MNTRSTVNSLLIAFGLACLITGVLLFFNIKNFYIKTIHEWDSIVFGAACLAHCVLNGKPLLTYLKKPCVRIALLVLLIFSVVVCMTVPRKPHPRPGMAPYTQQQGTVPAAPATKRP
ncbi:MAG: DUF4405 domain-containing protein [Desulfovibrionaceae bacterium]|nr:DUF4405 domain-containing protein [Desulfovibrionaceae bacterium]